MLVPISFTRFSLRKCHKRLSSPPPCIPLALLSVASDKKYDLWSFPLCSFLLSSNSSLGLGGYLFMFFLSPSRHLLYHSVSWFKTDTVIVRQYQRLVLLETFQLLPAVETECLARSASHSASWQHTMWGDAFRLHALNLIRLQINLFHGHLCNAWPRPSKEEH